jgi:hypothetical protein
MTPIVAGLIGAAVGAGGVAAAIKVRHMQHHKDQKAGEVLNSARAGALPPAALKQAAVAFGVEAVKQHKKGNHLKGKAYERAMREVAVQGAAAGFGFDLHNVVRDVNAITNGVGQYLTSPTVASPMYPPAYAPDLYASGPYDYHLAPLGDPMRYPDPYRHHDRHF